MALAILFFSLASPAWATTYFLATAAGGGSDSNNGTSASTPWLTPNHSVNCGDVILAAASTAYAAANFVSGKWGTVTCMAGNNVAWLKCASFDTCKITTTSNDAMQITASYWGVQGWETSASGGGWGCFAIVPLTSGANIHHIILANNIANTCSNGGFTSAGNGSAGVDYLIFVGNIVYNAAQGSDNCYSGLSMYEPAASDTLPGTHLYIAGNFSSDNIEPNPCNGGAPTDGEGLIFDTFQTYAGQSVADNNILIFNGAPGLEINSSQYAAIYFRHNTVYSNNRGTAQGNFGSCGEIFLNGAYYAESYLNIAETNASPIGCAGNTIYTYFVQNGNGTDHVYSSYGYDVSSHNYTTWLSTGFVDGPNNVFGTNPSFANPVNPGAPSCGIFTSVPNCMATVIANFTPTTAAAIGYGYQIPSTAQTYDPLFPQWLCNVNLPPGLVTMGCLALSSLPAAPTNVTATVVTVQ